MTEERNTDIEKPPGGSAQEPAGSTTGVGQPPLGGVTPPGAGKEQTTGAGKTDFVRDAQRD
jgi:hypothetical protein